MKFEIQFLGFISHISFTQCCGFMWPVGNTNISICTEISIGQDWEIISVRFPIFFAIQLSTV
jgi:hypothetical protein